MTARPADPPLSPLDRLAERLGILMRFDDAHGVPVTIKPTTRDHLLRAMGVDVSSESEAETALAELDRSEQAQILPPVLVIQPDDSNCAIPLRSSGSIAWRVTLEDGSVRVGEGSVTSGKLIIADLPFGYHSLDLPDLNAKTTLIVAPRRCWLPAAIKGTGKLWGISLQLYALRSQSNWGIGDFSDLQRFIAMAGPKGCDVVGLNPIHQMFLDRPELASPYSPVTRLFLNVLNIDVTAIPEYSTSSEAQALVASDEFQRKLAATRATPSVDYTAASALKLDCLKLLFAHFQASASQERRAAFAAFCAELGESLFRASLFQALRQHFGAEKPELADWQSWPEEFQTPDTERVRLFAEAQQESIIFFSFLQFLAETQLGAAARFAREQQGMSIGLYRDLAVGCDRAGAETWVDPSAFLENTLVGAPPDIFNPAGQNWGLPPLNPRTLRDRAYDSFITLVRANMRRAGALRIDHVMGLARLYCIPEGRGAGDGTYVTYPIDDMIAILTLESHRHACMVVGEDLGTVPPGLREKLSAANILSYRVLMFEQDSRNGNYNTPEDYPRLAVAVAGNHDLPTLLAWWEGEDLAIKEKLGLFPTPEETERQHDRRARDRNMLVLALEKAGALPSSENVSTAAFVEAAHAYLASVNSALVVAQLDDMLGETEQINVPGTPSDTGNWRRKYSETLEDLAKDTAAWTTITPFTERH